MSKLDATLAKEIQNHPRANFRVIVRVQGDLATRHAELQELGFAISRTLRLIRGFGATATGARVQDACEKEWIVSIEPDGEMRTMKNE